MWCTMMKNFGDLLFASDWVVPETFESKNAVALRKGSLEESDAPQGENP